MHTTGQASFQSSAGLPQQSARGSRRGFSLCASVIALVQAGPLWADAAPPVDNTATGGDIIVTAQKRDERLIDVPIAITAIKADTLVAQNLVTAKDYLADVPGVQVSVRQAGRTQIDIRGINTGNGGNPLVGIVIDDVPFGSSTVYGQASGVFPDLDPFILSQVEVLRGPQGTLYGASSMGGLIKLETRQPSLTETSGAVQTGVNGVTDGGIGYAFRGAVNTPLVTDKIAVSVSGVYRRDAGYIADPGSGQKDQDDARTYGGRAALLGQLSDTVKIRLSALYQDQRADTSSQIDTDVFGNPLYGDLAHKRLPNSDGFHSQVQFDTLVIDKQVGPVTISSLSGYVWTKLDTPTDITLTSAGMASGATGLSNPGVIQDSRVTTKKFTEELRATSDDTKRLSYIAGLYYGNERSYFYQDRYAADKTTGALVSPTFFDVNLPSSFREYAAYATLTWRVAPKLDLMAGGRFSHDVIRSNETDIILGDVSNYIGRAKENPATYSVSARYHVSSDVMLYARAASGYRAGGSNSGPPAALIPTYKSDNITNYEFGLKGKTLDGKVSGSVSAYYIDWSDIQVTQKDSDNNSYVTNAGKAKSEGFEATITVRPTDRFSLSSNLTYDNAVLTQDVSPTTFYALKGDRLPYTAKWMGTAGGQYTLPIREGLSAFVGVEAVYTGQRFSDFVATASQVRFNLPAYTTVDLRTGIDFDKWNLTLFARNVGDSRGYLSGRPLKSNNAAPIAVSVTTPRTVGAALTAKF